MDTGNLPQLCQQRNRTASRSGHFPRRRPCIGADGRDIVLVLRPSEGKERVGTLLGRAAAAER